MFLQDKSTYIKSIHHMRLPFRLFQYFVNYMALKRLLQQFCIVNVCNRNLMSYVWLMASVGFKEDNHQMNLIHEMSYDEAIKQILP